MSCRGPQEKFAEHPKIMKRRISQMVRWTTLACVLPGLASTSRGDDWPQWRGAGREGVWREQGIVETLPAGGLPVRWRSPLGPGFSGPAVAKGRVYVMDLDIGRGCAKDVKTQWNYRDKTTGRERVVCLDEATGKELWTRAYPSPIDRLRLRAAGDADRVR